MPDPSLDIDRHEARTVNRMSNLAPLLCLLLLGANLRPALSSVAPMLVSIQRDLGLSSAAVGMLTTLPILCFGLFAPFATRLAARYSVERLILYGLLALATGLGARIFFGVPGLFAGTALVGAGIGIVMVLLPAVIKRDFPGQAGLTTGVYTMAVCLGAALASSVTVPIQEFAEGRWRPALAVWVVPALLSAWAWSYKTGKEASRGTATRYKVSGMYSSALAWQVTLFMGLQSALAFIVFGWLPSILIDRGMAPLSAGYVVAIIFAVQVASALPAPSIATRGRDQRAIICLFMVMTVAGLVGCLYASVAGIWAWAVLVGLGLGGSFSIAMALIVLRSPNPEVAASLSAMAQGIGYMIAALGPFAVGVLHEITHDWRFLGILFPLLGFAAFIAAMGAGRNLHIHAEVTVHK